MRKRRILILDDEPIVLSMLEHFFLDLGYEVLSCTTPSVCPICDINAVTCKYKSPCADIFITDIDMPKMNGFQLLENQNLRDCKLDLRNKAIISGYLRDGYEGQIKELGCNFFQKPFDFPEILAWVNECEKRINLAQPLSSL